MYNARKPFAPKAVKSKADIPDIHAESIEELREAFELFDVKGVGKISLSELVDSMQSLGFHDKNPMMFEMVNKISAKHDGGKATFPQFAEDLADLIRDNKQEKDLRMVFDMLDTKHTGRINLENLKKTAKEFGDTTSDAELLEMLATAKEFDPEGLGEVDELSNEVSFHDFYHLMTRGKPTAAAASATGTGTATASPRESPKRAMTEDPGLAG